MRYIQTLIGTCCLLISAGAAAEEAIKTFKAGERVKAAEINANFQAIMDEVEAARAEIADAVSFEGLEDVYGGLEEEAEEATSALESSAAAVVACSAEDTSCVIVGNKASVTCSAGETGKLQSVLSSPYANAAFLLVEIEGNCVEDNLLITRGAAFFSKNSSSSKASITAQTQRVATCVNNYCYFGNIDLNGQVLAARGSSLILEKDMLITHVGSNPSAMVVTEGAFAMFGSNISVDGSFYAEDSSSTVFYGTNNTIADGMTVKSASVKAQFSELTTPSLRSWDGANVQLKYGTYDIDYINLSRGSTMNVFMPAGLGGELKTKSIFVTQGSVFEGNFDNDNGFTMDASSDGTFPDPGVLYLWDNSTAFLSYAGGASVRGIQLDSSVLRLAGTNGSLSVDTLVLRPGAQIKSNDTSAPINVGTAITANALTSIQEGAVDISSATSVDIAGGCGSGAIYDDLCAE